MDDEPRPQRDRAPPRPPTLTPSQRDALLAVAFGAARASRFSMGEVHVHVSSRGVPGCPDLAQPARSCRALERLGYAAFPPDEGQGPLALTEAGQARLEAEFPPETLAAVARHREARRFAAIRDRAEAVRRRVEGEQDWTARRNRADDMGALVQAREAARHRVHAAAFAVGDGANDVDAKLEEIRAATRAMREAEARIEALSAEGRAEAAELEAQVLAAIRAEVPEAAELEG